MSIKIRRLIKAQQKELDGALVYRSLADIIDEVKIKRVLKKCASDEGKHAAILMKMTGKKLQASHVLEKGAVFLYRLMGRHIFRIIARSEEDGGNQYMKWALESSVFEEMANDEYHHEKICWKIAIR